MLKFHFLGTSSGVPTRQRNVTGLAVQRSDSSDWILVDAGEGTQHQIQQARLSLHDLSVICITHVHGDHCYGLPGMLASAGMAGRKKALTLIAPLPVWQWLQATQQLTDWHLPYAIEHVDVALHDTAWDMPGLSITRHALLHRVPSFAFRFAATDVRSSLRVAALKAAGVPPGPQWRTLQNGGDINFEGQVLHSADYVDTVRYQVAAVIGGDNADPFLLQAACQDVQLLIHEATYTQEVLEKVGPGPMHSSAQGVAQFAQSVALPNLVLTHLSARYHNAEGEAAVLAEAKKYFTGNTWLAQDGDVFELMRDGQLHHKPVAT
jgi:ribonuclease Z